MLWLTHSTGQPKLNINYIAESNTVEHPGQTNIAIPFICWDLSPNPPLPRFSVALLWNASTLSLRYAPVGKAARQRLLQPTIRATISERRNYLRSGHRSPQEPREGPPCLQCRLPPHMSVSQSPPLRSSRIHAPLETFLSLYSHHFSK